MLPDGTNRCARGCCKSQREHYLSLTTVVGQAHDESTAWDTNLDRYEWAVKQGIQPEGTTPPQVEAAIAASQITDRPFRADA